MDSIERAIQYFKQEIRFCENAPALNGCEMTEEWLLTRDACKLAVEALKNLRVLESNFRVNEPLTLDELQKMNGQPVWIAEENAWGIVAVDSCGLYEDRPFVKFRYDTIWCDYDIERRNLHCYRYKPEEKQ